jgi:amidophosphoribosyltransferase
MAKELGADSLRYLPVESIARSVSLSPDRLCRACITSEYPTETGTQLYQIEVASSSDVAANRSRAYEAVSTPS